jgi:hypothetical protein
MVATGLLKPGGHHLIQRVATPEHALDALTAARPARAPKWITPDER